MPHPHFLSSAQRGFALIVAMVMLLILTMVAVIAMRSTTLDLKMSANTTLAQRISQTREKQRQQHQQHHHHGIYADNQTQYSLLDDSDHREAVYQRFMLKQLPRMLAMIALGACHMALMLDVRSGCNNIVINNANASKFVTGWLC